MEIAEIPRTLVTTGVRGLHLPVEVIGRAACVAEEADAERQHSADQAECTARRKEIVEDTKALQSELEATELEAQAEALAASEERMRELRRQGS